MAARKNVLVIYTDQQRADSLGCMGNPLARTPNLDRLAARGCLYTQHYAVNPVCMPSRASFFTGRYPQAHRLIDNGVHLPARELTMPEVFRRNGYRTASFGKLHFQTYKPIPNSSSMEDMGRWASGELDGWSGPYYGFEQVALTVGHGENCSGAYGRWRQRHFPGLKLGPENAQGPKFPQFACYKSSLPLEAHHSTWVTDRACEWLGTVGQEPFFAYVSFPDPHHPFAPPAPYHSLFEDVQFPNPHAVPGENERKPRPYREAMTGNPFHNDGGARFHPDLAGPAYQQILAHTHGMVALIDDCVGRLLGRLEELGLERDTIVVFTSDHGDLLGDHHFIQKGPLPCRSLLHVPLMVANPESAPGRVDAVVSNVDVMPTLLAACGLEIPAGVQGSVLPGPGEPARRPYALASGWSKVSPAYRHDSLYLADWRITVYPNLRDGELYNLRDDPYEHYNLYHDAGYRTRRNELMGELLLAVGAAEEPHPPVLTDW